VLRLIAGLERPEGGRVLVDDRDCTDLPVQARGVGFVFQGYALFQHLTVRKNIAFGLRIQKCPPGELRDRVDELLKLVQLENLGDRYPVQLSGGQRQRVAFARSLATRPGVLLLDEPFGALDARVRLELRHWLRRLHERMPVTTILVTHDQDEALELSQQVVVMHEGRVVQIGTPHDVYDHPATPFVASFIGNANVLTGRIEAGQLKVGALGVTAPAGARDGNVQAYVRPHDVKLSRPHADAPPVSLAVVEALTRVGAQVKVDLRLPSAEAMTVQIPKTEVDALGIAEGDRVLVDLGRAKVFVEDYSI
jgi:sulfate transport system ATP-binding protein